MTLPSIIVVGFPKAGTTTLHRALSKSGLVCAHWRVDDDPFGQLIYDGWFTKGDPLALFEGVDAITQMDYCAPAEGVNLWPNLDIALLLTIRRLHPECRFILNARDPGATARSIGTWHDMAARVTTADITGLPRGRGATEAERARWIEAHHAALREIFAGDPRFLDLDIAAPDAPDRLGAFLGRKIRWWGVANATPQR
ncbi:sulfotransferase [Paenirhodobacter sp.]|uniref:sulfotransferase n=1 Tax=Paenirhodobacter sp. TaxID=1965326 RepID=UPI003B3C4AA6